jgi:HPt (histidine-containing phosphotransfer) domain-containing protein
VCRPFSYLAWTVPEFLDQLFVEDPQFLDELVQIFIQDTAAKLTVLQKQRSLNDTKAVGETVHALKGSCRQMGAMTMADMLNEIEESLVSGAFDDRTREFLVTLESAFHAVRREMNDGVVKLGERRKAKYPSTGSS